MTQTSYDLRSQVLNKFSDLQGIEITTGVNGYPKGLHAGVAGFDSLEDAERIAKEYDGKVVYLYQRNGWEFWEVQREPVGMFGTERFQDDVRLFETAAEVEQKFREDLQSIDFSDLSIDAVQELAEKYAKLREMVENMDEDCVLVRYGKDEAEIEQKKVMCYHYDSQSYAIGVELHTRELDITDLDELAEFINGHEEWDVAVNEIIEENNWEDLTGNRYEICSDGVNKVIFDETGKALVV